MGVVIIQMARSSIQPEPLSAGLRRGARRGFTLLELLVVVAIIAMLVAILVSTVVKVRGSTRGFVCKNNLKTVAFDFLQFADEYAHPYRGDSERFGRSSFDLEDFQERVYGIAEFWKVSGLTEAAYEPSKQPLMCPGGPNPLKKQAGVPCRDYAVTPAANVSVADAEIEPSAALLAVTINVWRGESEPRLAIPGWWNAQNVGTPVDVFSLSLSRTSRSRVT